MLTDSGATIMELEAIAANLPLRPPASKGPKDRLNVSFLLQDNVTKMQIMTQINLILGVGSTYIF